MLIPETFFYDGARWQCVQCYDELHFDVDRDRSGVANDFAEFVAPAGDKPSNAKWADSILATLVCPRCGISEMIEKN